MNDELIIDISENTVSEIISDEEIIKERSLTESNEEATTNENTVENTEEENINPPSPETDFHGEIISLKQEIGTLRTLIANRESAKEELTRELTELESLFPGTTLSDIPESVFDVTKHGIPLSAAYALHIKKAEREARVANETNLKNAGASAGSVGYGAPGEYFSPDEVKSMSRTEVKANYNKIIESMKKWN